MPEAIPAGISIARARLISAFTQAVFEPLVGATKYSEFNSGLSDHWGGVYTFKPTNQADTARLMAWIRRLKNIGKFYAYDPSARIPAGGVVSGMTYTSATGNLLSIAGGPVSATPLVTGDYIQVGTSTSSPETAVQYFQLLENLTTNGSGVGSARVWPTPRPGLTAGTAVVTENPVMIARITSPVPQETGPDRLSQITISWEEV